MFLTLEQVRQSIHENTDTESILHYCLECRHEFYGFKRYCPNCHSLNIKPVKDTGYSDLAT